MVMRNRTMEARPTYGPNRTRSSTREQWRRDIPTDQSEHGHRQVNSEGETDLWINQSTVIDNRTMDARPTNGPNRTQSSTRQQRRRDRPTDQTEHGHWQENNEGETDQRTKQNTVIDNRTMDARPTNGPNRTQSSTRQQRRRDRPTDQSEHGHRQVNNEGKTNLRITQSMVIDKWTMESRPTYGSIRARSSTIEQWMRDKPTDQSEHGQAQYNNGDESDLRTKKNTVMRNGTVEARPNYIPIRTLSSTSEQWRWDRLTDQSEHGHRQENNGGETNLRTNQNTVMHNRRTETRPTKDQLEQGHAQ